MRSVSLFVAGLVVGVTGIRIVEAQGSHVRGLNHVGISVANYEQALDFYTEVMQFGPESLQRKAIDAWK